MSELNPIVKEWIEALRSGEYPQAKKALRTNEGFCCLGVLCDIATKHNVIPAPSYQGKKYFYDNASNYLSNKIIHWAGMITNSDCILARMNDEGYSFNYIADYIEQNPNIFFNE